ncbi:unnamed protein product [Cylicostephanus goldi]|uniref:Uncharacterized protein n=1 Tax=Cylicostephanus goldi TaxID=71465 RepID=A0A3P7N6Q6_CYLGO|nr:unnamed protein product [Cylicostephanus goldi]
MAIDHDAVLHIKDLINQIVNEDNLGREKDKKDREKDKEIDKMSHYLIAICEGISEDIMKWTGNYVKNIKNSDLKINLANLKIALSADKALMQLSNSLRNDDDDQSPGGFLSNFYEFDLDESDEEVEQNTTYESVRRFFYCLVCILGLYFIRHRLSKSFWFAYFVN